MSAVEIMDKKVLRLTENKLSISVPWDLDSPYYVLVETMGFDRENDSNRLEAFFEQCFSSNLASTGVVAQDEKQRSQIWGAREACGPAVNAAKR